MLTVAVFSLKGGVGKTSIALGLASAALARDLPILVIDLDPQADATAGLDVISTAPGLVKVLKRPRRKTVEAAVVPSGWTPDSTGRVDLLGAGAALARWDGPDSVAPNTNALRTALRKLPHDYALVLFDCPPNLGGLTRAALAASDRGLVVAEPGMFSVTAADRALRLIDDLRRTHAPQLQPLGILVNRVRRTSEHRYRITELSTLFGPLILTPHVPERADTQRAQGEGRPIHQTDGAGATAIARDLDSLLDRTIRSRRP